MDLAATSIVPRETTRISSELDRGSGTALLERPATAKKYVRMVFRHQLAGFQFEEKRGGKFELAGSAAVG